MKKLLAIIVCAFILIGAVNPAVFAEGADGMIDLYEVFSNKTDQMKTEVGSRVYNWSMHLPDDAIIYKSEQVNYFNMSTTSYQSSVSLEVNKNTDNLTLEEMLYNMQNQSKMGYYWIWGDKEFQVGIAEDDMGQKYIRIIKTSGFYDYFLVDEAAEEFREYVENRIYIANNYIYNLTVFMNGEFYRQHEEMFSKLVSSFKLSFDNKNPYIKELSDSVSTTREYKNTSYGWKITLNPYWKVEGTPNARNQSFRPVYTDEELNADAKPQEESMDEFKVPEGITVSLTGSAQSGETSTKWAEKEIEKFKRNYNSKVFDILKSEARVQGNTNVHRVTVRYKTVTKKPYIIDNLYVIGNGYKYLVSAIVMEEQYQDSKKRSGFEAMLNSFVLDKTYLSKYLGKITEAESLMDLNASKELKMKKYDFATRVTKSWNTNSNYGYYNYGRYYDKFYYMDEAYGYGGNVSNNEFVSAFQPESNMIVNMSAGLNTAEMDEIMKQKAERFLNDDEIRMGLASVKIQSAVHNGASICYIAKEYNLDAINKFVNEDKTKTYNLESLSNEYEYTVKIGKDLFTQSIMIPVANTTSENLLKANNIWGNTTINKVNYSKLNLGWKQHKLEEFDKEKRNLADDKQSIDQN